MKSPALLRAFRRPAASVLHALLALGLMQAGFAFAAPAEDKSAEPLRLADTEGVVDCTGRDVEVLANDADLRLTGRCLEIYIVGDRVRARIEHAGLLQVVGNNAAIELDAPLGELRVLGHDGRYQVGAVEGELYVQGHGSTIHARQLSEVRLTGSGNEIRWQQGSPSVDDIGGGNRTLPAK